MAQGVTIHGTDKTKRVMSFTDVAGSLRTKPPGSQENSSTTAVAHTLKGEGFDASEHGTGRGTPIIADACAPLTTNQYADYEARESNLIPDVANPLTARMHKGINTTADEGQTPLPVAFAQNSRDEVRKLGGDGSIAGALAAEPGSKQQTYLAVNSREDPEVTYDSSGPLGASTPQAQGVAFECRFARNGRGAPSEVVPPLKAQSGQTGKGDAAPCVAFAHNTQPNMAVRRLTPIECERLQGFPDDFTRIPWRGKEPDNCPDGPRYKALGNSMAVNCMEWIAARIQLISEMDAQE